MIPINYQAASMFVRNERIKQISNNIKNAIIYMNGYSPHVFHDDIAETPLPTITIRCLTHKDLNKSAALFQRMCAISPEYFGLVNSASIHRFVFLFDCRTDIGVGFDAIEETRHDLHFQVKFSSYEAHMKGENPPYYLNSTHDTSIEPSYFQKLHGSESINSANLSSLAEVIYRNMGVPFIQELVWSSVIHSLRTLGVENIGKAYELISGESQYLMKKHNHPNSPFMIVPSSIFVFSMAIKQPYIDFTFARRNKNEGRPSLMSCNFAGGLIEKHGEAGFARFRESNNFRVVS